ncbi:MAG: hypothetical protein GY904_13060 [Planctomycetaceae bacterium]|nr:hypothetical protein [Planctomycetaceae bacterium]
MIACSSLLKLLTAVVWAVLPVTVQTNSGETVEGELIAFSSDSLTIGQDGNSVEIPFEDVDRLVPNDAEEGTGPAYRVTLVGGSKIMAQDVSLKDSQLTIEPRRQNALTIPVKQVKAIRFRPASTSTDAAWFGNFERENRGDSLILRRSADTLDSLSVIVMSIENKRIGFDLEGTTADVDFGKLEGVLFGGGTKVAENPEIQVTDIWGSKWAATAIQPSQADQPLKIELTSSTTHTIPLEQILSIRWSGGVALLTGLKPVAESLKTFFPTTVQSELMTSFFGNRKVNEQNLSMVGGSSAEYRVEPGYQLFSGSVRRDSDSEGGQLIVKLQMDGKVVWEETLEDSEPKGFELPLGEARRLSIEVSSGKDGDLGDRVLFVRPRMLK